MHLKRIPMDTSRLRVGMYVGALDRPWTETPFVFQGFVIKDSFDIDQLQSYCSEVYVEIDRGKLTETEIRSIANDGGADERQPRRQTKSAELPNWLKRWLYRTRLGELLAARARNRTGAYVRSATVRMEAPHAKQAYKQCVNSYKRIFEEARRTGVVDIKVVIRSVKPVIESILRNPDAMAWTVFSGKRSNRHYSRAVATAVWAVMFGRHLGFDRAGLKNLAVGGLLLDIGYVSLPDEILNTMGAFYKDELLQVRKHVQAGMEVLRRSNIDEPAVLDMLKYHHERYDGSGYPHQLKGRDITPHGRIAGIVDCYDAMTTKSSYSPAQGAYAAARELNEMRDQQFHAEVVEQFLKTIGMFPTGSVVELNDGSAGLVLEQNPENSLHPKVVLLRTPSGELFDPPRTLKEDDWADSKVWIAKGHEHGAYGIDPMEHFA